MSDYELNKNYYIEASAGTGKTYNIIAILKVLLKSVDIKNILIVTYTDKAVEELKNRVRKMISGKSVNDSEIYTIHSFCQKSIREYCVSCNKPINLDVIDESEVESFVDRYIRDDAIYQDIISAKEDNRAFSYETLKNYLVSAVKKYYLNKDKMVDYDIVSIKSIYVDLASALTFDDLRELNPSFYQMVESLNKEEASDKAKKLYEIVSNNYNPFSDDFFNWSFMNMWLRRNRRSRCR